jgi:hypothetical protein
MKNIKITSDTLFIEEQSFSLFEVKNTLTDISHSMVIDNFLLISLLTLGGFILAFNGVFLGMLLSFVGIIWSFFCKKNFTLLIRQNGKMEKIWTTKDGQLFSSVLESLKQSRNV